MPHTETFFIHSETKAIMPIASNPREYFRKGGKYEGMSDMIIEVFALANHVKHAEYLHHVLRMGNLQERYFHIRIEVKD